MDIVSLLHLSTLLVLSSATDTYIVRVQNDLKPSHFSRHEDWYISTFRSLATYSSTSPKPNENQEDAFIYVYKTVFHGFSARLTQEQAEELSGREEILGVLPDRVRQLQTTRSGQFMGLDGNNPAGLMMESDWGSNVIIGVLDTGISPERRSFSDEGIGDIPSHWKGECVEGVRFTKHNCNKKIIGARYFTGGYEAKYGGLNNISGEIKSARDTDFHGTHTASTAAGRAVANASFFGLAAGVAVGIAPKARIAVYKICWNRNCVDSDILAAFDAAARDGVDVISLSVNGWSSDIPYSEDPIAIGAFAASAKGVFVSNSAGNAGPAVRSVSDASPWVTSVGAGTIDRKFLVDLILGDGTKIVGSSLYTGKKLPRKTLLPIIYAGNASLHSNSTQTAVRTCYPGTLDKKLVRGKIVVCDRGFSQTVFKGQEVKEAGGVGVVVENIHHFGEGLMADAHIIPALMITESAGDKVRAYISGSKDPKATMIFHGTQVGVKPAPTVAAFSSRGPNSQSIYVLKPDVIAPGVNILAAWPDDVAPTDLPSDLRRTEFGVMSGTSMSCPHVSGLAALLKGAHPDWSPAMIRSALMTTAYTNDQFGNPLLDEVNYEVANVWGMGAGHVDPKKAVDPGLVYDLTVDDYINFLCASGYKAEDIKSITHKQVNCTGKEHRPWDINYPAMSFGAEMLSSNGSRHEVVLKRTVTNVDDGVASYRAKIVPPKGTKVRVEPTRLEFKGKGEKRSYVVKVMAEGEQFFGMRRPGNVTSWTETTGKLTWTDGKHHVSSHIVVVGSG